MYSAEKTLLFNRITPKAIIPRKAHDDPFHGDAAYDLFTMEDIKLKPLEQKLISTGIRFIIPAGYWIKFHERSGLANKGIQVHGGVIDNSYSGEVKVILYNGSNLSVAISANSAITQFTIEKMREFYLVEMTEEAYLETTANNLRGKKGFGSSD